MVSESRHQRCASLFLGLVSRSVPVSGLNTSSVPVSLLHTSICSWIQVQMEAVTCFHAFFKLRFLFQVSIQALVPVSDLFMGSRSGFQVTKASGFFSVPGYRYQRLSCFRTLIFRPLYFVYVPGFRRVSGFRYQRRRGFSPLYELGPFVPGTNGPDYFFSYRNSGPVPVSGPNTSSGACFTPLYELGHLVPGTNGPEYFFHTVIPARYLSQTSIRALVPESRHQRGGVLFSVPHFRPGTCFRPQYELWYLFQTFIQAWAPCSRHQPAGVVFSVP